MNNLVDDTLDRYEHYNDCCIFTKFSAILKKILIIYKNFN